MSMKVFSNIERYAITVDQSRNRLLYFGLLSAFLLILLFPLNRIGNEENYFQLAFRKVYPETFSPFHAVFDKANARFVGEYLFGSLVGLFGHDVAIAVARVAMALFYAASLTYFFRSLRLSVLDGLIILVLFHLAGEELLGGEWLFFGVESKTCAYAFVLVAFGLVNHGRWLAAILACVAAAYMHFLVGGFWALVVLLLQWYKLRDIPTSTKTLLAFCLLLSPLVYVIASDQFTTQGHMQGTLSANAIYAYATARHVSPFAGTPPFMFGGWLQGFISTVFLALAMAVLVSRDKSNLINIAGLIGLIELILAVLVSYLDRNTFFFGKFYLFRPSSLTLFFVITGLMGILNDNLTVYGHQVKSLLLCALMMPFFSWSLSQQIHYYRQQALPEKKELVTAIEAYAKPDDIVLLEPYNEFDPAYLRLHRDIRQPTLVSSKFVPTNPDELLRWYSLIQMRKAIFDNGCENKLEFPIRWLVTFRPKSMEKLKNCGQVVWRNRDVALIEIDERYRK